jgi:hypothetical protein
VGHIAEDLAAKDGISADEMISTVDQVVRAAGGAIDDDCLLTLADTKDEEPDPEPIEDAAEALTRLRACPTLGTISYSMPESVINVTFRKRENEERVYFCKVSILQSSIESGGDDVKGVYKGMAQDLYQRLSATRVMFDWGIEYKGLDWQQELARLQHGEVVGSFDLDLHVRRCPVNSDFRDVSRTFNNRVVGAELRKHAP